MSVSIASLLALAGLLICVFMGLRMLLKPRQQQALDARLRRWQFALLQRFQTLTHRLRREPGRHQRPDKKAASAEAQAAIRRAQAKARQGKMPEGRWDGNVYRPTRFGGKTDEGPDAQDSAGADEKKPRNLH